MSKNDTDQISDPVLWRQFRDGTRDQADQKQGGAVLDALTVAAYLDGSLDEAERGRIEAVLAHSPDDLELVMATREALGDAGAPAPDFLVTRACDLVPEQTALAGRVLYALERLRSSVTGFSAWFWTPLAWSGVAAAMALVCTLGFQLGETGYAGVLAADQLPASETLIVLGPSVDEFL